MHKTLILPICLYALAATAADDCTLGIQKITPNTLSFSYTPEAKIDTPYFYVKALPDSETPAKNTGDIIATGENLLLVADIKPNLYQVPEHTKTLYIFKAPSKLDSVDASAQIIPAVNDTDNYNKMPKRNAGNYLGALPDATIELQPVKNITIQKKTVQVCELTL
jgi:hypothetical protein